MQLKSAERYWNPHLETLPPRQLRDFQFKKFKRIVKWDTKTQALSTTLRKSRVKSDDPRTEDISKVLLSKSYRTAQAKNRIRTVIPLCTN